MSESETYLAPTHEAERLELLRTERRHLWVRLGVAAVAVVIILSLPVAVPALAVFSATLLVVFPFVARWLGRDPSRERLRAITRLSVTFYVIVGALWVVLLAANEQDLALAIAAPTAAAAATLGLRAALAATALLFATELVAEYLRVAVYGHGYQIVAVALQLAGIVGIGVITGLGIEALRAARRTGRRLRRAQTLLTGLAPRIAGTLDEEEAFRLIVRAAVDLTNAGGGHVALRDPETGRYRLAAPVNAPPEVAGQEVPPGQGVESLVSERGETVVLAGSDLRAVFPTFARAPSLTAAMGTPVRIGPEIVAVPVVWTSDPFLRFDAVDRTTLESLATLATSVLANARQFARAEVARRRLQLLHEVRTIVGSSLELETILARALEQLEAAFGMDRTFVLLLDDDGHTLRLRAHRGAAREDIAGFTITLDRGLSGAAFRERRIVNVPDVAKDERYVLTAPDVRSEIVLPLVVADAVVGVLIVSSPRLAAFGPDEEQLLALFAGEVSVAVANARAYEEQREAAIRDDRTGLYNHRYFREVLHHEVASAERRGTPLSLLFVDLDDLKGINDRHGHDAGDAVIVRVAELMTCARRRTDVAARIGGEEFALLLPEAGHAEAVRLAEELRAEVARQALAFRDATIAFTVSIGVATYPHAARDAAGLRQAADLAMYEAKRAGRNRVGGVLAGSA